MRLPQPFNAWRAQLADDFYLVYKFGFCQGHVLSDRARASVEDDPSIRNIYLESARLWAREARSALEELVAKANSKEIEILRRVELAAMGYPPDPVLPRFIAPGGQIF